MKSLPNKRQEALRPDDRDAGSFSLADHIGRSSPAREGDHHIRLALGDHPGIADRAGSLAVLLPIGMERDDAQMLAFAPTGSAFIRTAGSAVDERGDARERRTSQRFGGVLMAELLQPVPDLKRLGVTPAADQCAHHSTPVLP